MEFDNMKRSRKISIGTIVLFVVCSLIYYRNDLAVLIGNKTNSIKVVNVNDNTSLENSNIPDYSGNSYIIINNNKLWTIFDKFCRIT